MELIPLKPTVSLLPVVLVIGVAVLGFLSLAAGRSSARKISLPFLALLAVVLLLAWMITAI